jgi:hypothetical protein
MDFRSNNVTLMFYHLANFCDIRLNGNGKSEKMSEVQYTKNIIGVPGRYHLVQFGNHARILWATGLCISV